MATATPAAVAAEPPPADRRDLVTDATLIAILLLGGNLAGELADKLGIGAAFAAGRLSPAQSRRLMAALALDGEDSLRDLTERLVGGKIRVDAWRRSFAREVTTVDAAATLAAFGSADLPLAAARDFKDSTNRQLGYLAGFAALILAGRHALGPATIARAGLYGHAAWPVGMGVFRSAMARSALAEESRKLGAADSCDDCIAAEAEGWQPIGTLPAIGESECRARCKCWFEFR